MCSILLVIGYIITAAMNYLIHLTKLIAKDNVITAGKPKLHYREIVWIPSKRNEIINFINCAKAAQIHRTRLSLTAVHQTVQ